MSHDPHARPKVPRPDLVEERDGRVLLVWGAAGAWIVADREFHELVGQLRGHRTALELVQALARRWQRSPQQVAREVGPALDTLHGMGVLDPVEPGPDLVEIANVTINVTNRCNLRCTHCYNDPRGKQATAEQLVEALRGGVPVLGPGASLIILGGEPLLDLPRLETLVRGAAEIFDLPPMVSTNGTLIDAGVARRLADLGVDMQVSLDGTDAASNDPVRGDGSYDRAVAGVRHLRDAGVPVTLSMVYGHDNLEQMEAYCDLALALDATEVRFIPLRLIGRGAEHPEAAPDQVAALDHLLALLHRRPELRPLLRRDFFSITREVCRLGGARTHCGIGRRVVFLDADGAVYPCPNHRTELFRVGDALCTPLAEIVRDSPGMRAVREQYTVDRYDGCADCPVRAWCSGDCRGEVLALFGRGDGPAPHCDEMKRLVPRLMWLIADGDPRLGAEDPRGAFL